MVGKFIKCQAAGRQSRFALYSCIIGRRSQNQGELFYQIRRTHDGMSAVTNEEIAPHRCGSVDITGNDKDRTPQFRSETRRDQRTPLFRRLHNDNGRRSRCNHSVSCRKTPSVGWSAWRILRHHRATPRNTLMIVASSHDQAP